MLLFSIEFLVSNGTKWFRKAKRNDQNIFVFVWAKIGLKRSFMGKMAVCGPNLNFFQEAAKFYLLTHVQRSSSSGVEWRTSSVLSRGKEWV